MVGKDSRRRMALVQMASYTDEITAMRRAVVVVVAVAVAVGVVVAVVVVA